MIRSAVVLVVESAGAIDLTVAFNPLRQSLVNSMRASRDRRIIDLDTTPARIMPEIRDRLGPARNVAIQPATSPRASVFLGALTAEVAFA